MCRYCPGCNDRISHRWFQKNIFCCDLCRKNFIKKIQKIKIKGSFGDTRAHRRRRKKEYREYMEDKNAA